MNANAIATPQDGGARSLRFAALLATYMQSANLPLPNSALRFIQGSLSMTDDQAGWIFTAYLGASAITLPLAQWLAGRFGVKLVYQAALVLFIVGLWLATAATTPLEFVGARIVQGIASGVLGPLSMGISWRRCQRRGGRNLARCSPPLCSWALPPARLSAVGSATVTAGARCSTPAFRCRCSSFWWWHCCWRKKGRDKTAL
jgi:MFS family permease